MTEMKHIYELLATIAEDVIGAGSDEVLETGILAFVIAECKVGMDEGDALKFATSEMVEKNKEVA